MRHLLSLLFFLHALCGLAAPRLVVGIVVDQMRWDYLTRYADRYSDGGFKRLQREGYEATRMLIDYLPTVTAVGHTSIYTGSVPAYTGIVGNTFPDGGRTVAAVQDDSVTPVGTTDAVGKASPRRLLTTTLTDQLRLATHFRARTIGIALKDRAAILPAGHAATAAYWLDPTTGRFVSSSYYMDELPQWLRDFNAAEHRLPAWRLLYPADTYVQSAPKGQPYEQAVGQTFKLSPYGNTLTLDMARAAIRGERLGHNADGVPDFLAVSLSSTDAIGHAVGPNSIYMEDTYLRLDRDLAAFLTFLDKEVGRGAYTVFLTADHGAAHNIRFRENHRLPAAAWEYFPVLKDLNAYLTRVFGAPLVDNMEGENVYFDLPALTRTGVSRQAVEDSTCAYLLRRPEVQYCFPFSRMPDFLPEPLRTMTRNGYHPRRSGQLQIILTPETTEDWDAGYLQDYDGTPRGTNHAVWQPYDAHIPFLLMGPDIPPARDRRTHHITDIAATLADLLGIQMPSACVGESILQ